MNIYISITEENYLLSWTSKSLMSGIRPGLNLNFASCYVTMGNILNLLVPRFHNCTVGYYDPNFIGLEVIH